MWWLFGPQRGADEQQAPMFGAVAAVVPFGWQKMREHPAVATTLDNLGVVYHDLGEYDKAELSYGRALGIFEKALGADHPSVATCLEYKAALFRKTDRAQEAEVVEERAAEIRAKSAVPATPQG